MNPEQFAQLLKVLSSMSSSKFTITGAMDWPIFSFMVGAFSTVIISLLCYIWHDLKTTIKDNRVEWRQELSEEIKEREKQDNFIWEEIRRCKDSPCPIINKQ